MELIKKLEELQVQQKFNKEEILKITSTDELIALVREQIFQEPNNNALYRFFDDLRETIIEKEGLNIFEEDLILKFFYFEKVYNIKEIVLYALMEVWGPVLLDYKLEREILDEDDFFQFYIKKYNQFKTNNEFTIFKLLKSLDINDLKLEQAELEQLIKKLETMTEV